jgi:hypothetical protein
MLTANLHRSHKVGDVVRLSLHQSLFKIVEELPNGKLDCFPGGTGIRTVALVRVADERSTSELAYTAEVKANFAKECPELV